MGAGEDRRWAILADMSSQTGEPAAATASGRAPGLVGRLSPVGRLDLATFVLVSAQGLGLFLLIARGGWLVDDFENLSIAQRSSLSRAYLTLVVFGHPEPGNRALNWVVMRIAPMNYAFVALFTALCVAATSWITYRILRLTFRPSPWMAVLAGSAGALVIWLPGSMWWASAVELAPCALASALACHATVRCYLGPRRILWGALAGGWVVVGLSYYERALVGAAVSMVFLPLAFCAKVNPAQILAVVRRAWPAYAAQLGVSAAYLATYLSGNYVKAQSGYSAGDLAAMMWRGWSSSLVPGLLGGPLQWRFIGGASPVSSGVYPIGDTPAWWVAVGQVAALAVLVLGITRLGWRSLRGWVMFLPLYFAAMYAVAIARLATYGPQLGAEFRYVADLAPMTALALAIALLRPKAPDTPPEAPDTPQAASDTPERAATSQVFNRTGVLLAGGFVAVTAAIVAASAVPAADRWAANPTETYVANLRRSLAEADRGTRWSLYNTIAPSWLMPFHYAPYSTLEYLGQLVTGRKVPVDDPTSRLLVVDGSGIARPAAFRSAATVPDHCTARRNETVVRALPRPLGNARWFLTLHYAAATPSTLRFAIDPGTGFVAADAQSTSYPVRGAGSLIVGLRRLPVARLRITAVTPGTCVTSVRIGAPVPADPQR
jgi:hypothetical protein